MDRLRRVVVPVFKGEEKAFPFWKKRFEQHLKQEGLLYTLERLPQEEEYANEVEGSTEEEEEERQKKWEKRLRDDDSTINELWLALDDEPMGHVMNCQYAREIMLKLEHIYRKKGAVAMLGLRANLYSLKAQGYGSLKELFARHQELVRELQDLNDPVPHKDQVNTLLLSIPDKYEHILGALSVVRRAELEAMSLEQIQRLFLDAEEAAQRNEAGPSGVAMFSGRRQQQQNRQQPRPLVQQERATANPTDNSPRKNASNVQCYWCGKYGHMKRNCRIFLKQQAQTCTDPDDNRDTALVTRGSEEFKVLLDSGATQHMLCDKRAFLRLWEAPQTVVDTAEMGSKIHANRRGDALLRTKHNARVDIRNVLFIPELTHNLLSVSAVESSGKSVHFMNGKVEIRDKDGYVVITGKRVKGLYELDVFLDQSLGSTQDLNDKAMKASVDGGELRQLRFDQLEYRNTSKMVNNNIDEKWRPKLSSVDVGGPIGYDVCAGKHKDESFGDDSEEDGVNEIPDVTTNESKTDGQLMDIEDTGMNVSENFAPAVKLTTVRVLGIFAILLLLLGCMQYLTITSRRDITVSTSILSKFQVSPGEEHSDVFNRILRDSEGMKNVILVYTRDGEVVPLRGYSDNDFANDRGNRKSKSESFFTVCGNTVSRGSKRQQMVNLSPTEAELVELCNAANEGVWMSSVLRETGINLVPFTMYEDNIPCIRNAEEAREYQRTKHTDVENCVEENKKIILMYIPSEDLLIDNFKFAFRND